MILYTPVPPEMIFAGLESPVPQMAVLKFKGKPVMGYQVGDGRYELTRVLSTDPADFLDPDLQPGRQIRPD
ncbi:MAG: YlzJ-like family protein [Heliobacteriaceae bacterium]|nr:YlzJ-like family protein [Heliobacteriaceae bacterium]